MNKTNIEWTDRTWNPVTGCTPVSPGCAHCYARRMAKRLAGRCGYPAAPHEFDVTLHPEKLYAPLRWKKPCHIFVGSMTDLFHEDVDSEFRENIFAVMALMYRHTFQILTKRAETMCTTLGYGFWQNVEAKAIILALRYGVALGENFDTARRLRVPLSNVWIGVTAENQDQADQRIPVLVQIPAAVRFVSIEPMLGPIILPSWDQYAYPDGFENNGPMRNCIGYSQEPDSLLDWIICGGETGPDARPMHPRWPRSLRDQCVQAAVPFFFKSWGDWLPNSDYNYTFAQTGEHRPTELPLLVYKTGKKAAGRLLDDREWNEFPAH